MGLDYRTMHPVHQSLSHLANLYPSFSCLAFSLIYSFHSFFFTCFHGISSFFLSPYSNDMAPKWNFQIFPLWLGVLSLYFSFRLFKTQLLVSAFLLFDLFPYQVLQQFVVPYSWEEHYQTPLFACISLKFFPSPSPYSNDMAWKSRNLIKTPIFLPF